METTIAKENFTKKLKYSLILLWVLVNIFQAYSTELAHDEAYYWVYSEFLDFGYFDHPPMIALLIKAGSILFEGELGVRIIIVFLNLVTLITLHELTNKKNFTLLFAIMCSISVFHVYGFIAVPDAPLLAFSALFFLLYKRYLFKQNAVNIVLLSLVIAMLLYSKYHGILLVFFTLLSNVSLLKQRGFYLIIILSLLFYSPHIYWQIINDYPSYKYHVLNKSQIPYNPLDTIVYLLGQLLIYGPIISGLLFYSAFKLKSSTHFEKALKYNLYGILLFFLFSTLNSKVEPNWTIIIFIPLVILSHQYITESTKLLKWTKRIAYISFVIFVVVRIELIHNFLPDSYVEKSEFHGWEMWAKEIQSKSNNDPVVFMNSYQKASKYSFYSSQTALSLNNVRYRRNQYDIWDIEDSMQGKSVFLIPNWDIPDLNTFETEKEIFNYKVIDNFRSYNKVIIECLIQNDSKFSSNELVETPLSFVNPSSQSIRFDQNEKYPVYAVCSIFKHEDFIEEQTLFHLDHLILKDLTKVSVNVKIPQDPGIYYLRFSLKSGWLPPSINSNLIRIIVV